MVYTDESYGVKLMIFSKEALKYICRITHKFQLIIKPIWTINYNTYIDFVYFYETIENVYSFLCA